MELKELLRIDLVEDNHFIYRWITNDKLSEEERYLIQNDLDLNNFLNSLWNHFIYGCKRDYFKLGYYIEAERFKFKIFHGLIVNDLTYKVPKTNSSYDSNLNKWLEFEKRVSFYFPKNKIRVILN